MTISMYGASVPVFARQLNALLGLLYRPIAFRPSLLQLHGLLRQPGFADFFLFLVYLGARLAQFSLEFLCLMLSRRQTLLGCLTGPVGQFPPLGQNAV